MVSETNKRYMLPRQKWDPRMTGPLEQCLKLTLRVKHPGCISPKPKTWLVGYLGFYSKLLIKALFMPENSLIVFLATLKKYQVLPALWCYSVNCSFSNQWNLGVWKKKLCFLHGPPIDNCEFQVPENCSSLLKNALRYKGRWHLL